MTINPLSEISFFQSSFPPFPVGIPANLVSNLTMKGVGLIMKSLSSMPSYPALLIALSVLSALS